MREKWGLHGTRWTFFRNIWKAAGAPVTATASGARGRSRLAWMVRDAQRYLPALADAKFENSLFDIKTLITQTQIDDARPIYFHRDRDTPRLVSILGGKIDNIFDILQFIDRMLDLRPSTPQTITAI